MCKLKNRRNRIRAALIGIAVLAVTLPFQLIAQTTLEERAKALETQLISPCCWRQPVAVHESGPSYEVRDQIRELLKQGKSSEQVLDHFVDQYGERILAAPRASGFNLTAYWIPLLVVGLGIGVVALFWRGHLMPPTPSRKPKPIDQKYHDQLRREIAG